MTAAKDVPTVVVTDSGSITVTERDLNGTLIRYTFKEPGDAFAYLADHGITDVELPLSSPDYDLAELVRLMDEYKALMEDVMVPDRNAKLFALWERFITLNAARHIAETDYNENTEGGESR